MSIHSGLLDDLMEQFSAAGCDVWAGDLRGHGGSVSARAPLAHLHPDDGWTRLVDDMDEFARVAFEGVPVRHRVMVGGTMACQVMLSLLLRHPDRAGQLVMAPPTPHRAGVNRLASAFLRLRRLTHALDQPDPQVMHHIYGFLRGGLSPGARDVDVISTHADVIARILDDPRGFPTPTLGYWLAVLPGMQQAWGQSHAMLEATLRVLIVSSPDDPHLNGGHFAPQIRDWFQERGVKDVRYLNLPGTRANPMVDARHAPFAARVMDWLEDAESDALSLPGTEVPTTSDVPSAYAAAINRIGLPADVAAPDLPELIHLCYEALDDEARWIELIYRLCLASEKDDHKVERLLEQVQPHWQRSFELREELHRAATLGVLYAEVIDRLALGVALLNADGRLRHANAALHATLQALMPDLGAAGAEAAIARLLAAQAAVSQRVGDEADAHRAEMPILWEDQAIGISFVPASLRQNQPKSRGPSPRLLVLRGPGQGAASGDDRAGLLSLAFGLTGQESAVALGLAEGLSTEAIAERLGIGESTVRSHLKQVFSKMQVSSRTELASRIMASPIGWLSPGPRGDVAPPAAWTRLP